MTEENNRAPKELEFQKKRKFDFLDFINIYLAIILVGAIVIIGMQFLAPNIPYFCTNMSLADECHLLRRFEERCTNNWERFPTGKLVLIVPKTMKNQIQILGFAYSPSVYSRVEINKIKQQFLRELNLREYEANIVKFDIFMDVNGYPRIHLPCGPQNNRFEAIYTKGENLFIESSGLTVWQLSYEIEKLQQDSQSINIEFVHDDPGLEDANNDPCGYLCEKVIGSASIELQNKLSFWDRVQAIWFFRSPIGFIYIFSLIVLIAYLVIKRIQQIRTNKTPE